MLKRVLIIVSCVLCLGGPAFADANSDLLQAVLDGNVTGVQQAIKAGADINAVEYGAHGTDYIGYTALMIAAEMGNDEVVAELLKDKNIKVNATVQDTSLYDYVGYTALMLAVSNYGRDEVVAKLLKATGIDVNAKVSDENKLDRVGYTALMLAALYGYDAMVAQLVAVKGIDVNAVVPDANEEFAGYTALMIAANDGYDKVVAELLKSSDIDVCVKGTDGDTALSCAQSTNHVAIVNMLTPLMEKCGTITQQSTENPTTDDVAAERARQEQEERARQEQEERARQEQEERARQERLIQEKRDKITELSDQLSKFNFKKSHWKNASGGFNTARLASDSVAGVVLGTAGGLITSSIVKKNQVKSGFEDLNCVINGQVVSGFHDTFNVDIR